MTSSSVLEKSEAVMAALEALRSRVSEEDQGTLEGVQSFIAEVTKLMLACGRRRVPSYKSAEPLSR